MAMSKFASAALLTLAMVAMVVSGCSKKKAEAKAQATEAAKTEKTASADEAASAAAAAPAADDNVSKAKAMIDNMTATMEKMLVDLEAAGGDQAKMTAVGESFKKATESMKEEGDKLNAAMSDAEKAIVEEYAKEKIAPVMGKYVATLQMAAKAQADLAASAGAAPGDAPAAPAEAAPAEAAPAEAAPAEATK